MASGPIFCNPDEVLFRHDRPFVLRNQHINSSPRKIHRDFDWGRGQLWSRKIAVSTTIRRNFNRGRGQLRFRQRFGAISIGGEDNCDFDDDSAQFRSALATGSPTGWGWTRDRSVGFVIVGTGGGEIARGQRSREGGRRPKRHPRMEEEAQEEGFLGGTGRGWELVQNSEKAEASRPLRRVVQQAVSTLPEAVAIIVQGQRRRRRGGSSSRR